MPRTLRQEISLNRPFHSLEEQLLHSLLATTRQLLHVGQPFFAAHGLTDAQFNLLMILWDYRRTDLSQARLAELLLVNRASAGSLIQRMITQKLVERRDAPKDRRAFSVTLAPEGERLLRKTRALYYRLMQGLFAGMPKEEMRRLLAGLERFRGHLGTRGAHARTEGKQP